MTHEAKQVSASTPHEVDRAYHAHGSPKTTLAVEIRRYRLTAEPLQFEDSVPFDFPKITEPSPHLR